MTCVLDSKWELRERLGSTFVAGLVVHTGPQVFRLAERIIAVPIGSLW